MRFKGATPGVGARAPEDALTSTLRALAPRFFWALAFSVGVNLLYLATPLYMLQIYDRVMLSGSITTLIFVSALLLLALATLGLLDASRARLLLIAGEELDNRLSGPLFGRLMNASAPISYSRSELLREFDSFRNFVGGSQFQAMIDSPWTPIYVVICGLLHPLLGVLALVSSVILFVCAFAHERAVRRETLDTQESAARSYASSETALRVSETVRALGMRTGLVGSWLRQRSSFTGRSSASARRSAGFTSFSKFLRLLFQSAALGLGAYLAIERQITPGAVVAGSILLGRALAPIEQLSGSWRGFVLARSAHRKLKDVLADAAGATPGQSLPRPRGRLSARGIVVTAPGSNRVILKQVSLDVGPGESVGIIGPSGAGKSTLARALVGAWVLRNGSVRLDEADITQIEDDELGRLIGYLPQEPTLFPGTVQDNISRFERFRPGVDMEQVEKGVLAAAIMADIDGMIRHLPDQYATEIGLGGAALSGGQAQRIALARALYGDPVALVLDEPNSNLDGAGERALAAVIQASKRAGRAIILIGHSLPLLQHVDDLILMTDGAITDRGKRDEVLTRMRARLPVTLNREGPA